MKPEKLPASSVSPQTGMNFPVVQFWGSNSRPKPSFRHPPCARTHSAHTKVQLYRFARRAVLVHTTATSSLMCHVITWSGDVSHRSGKDMRKKDEEWPRTGTFCAAWGRISVMQWPIFTGHFGPLRLLRFWAPLTIQSVMYTCAHVLHVCMCVHVLFVLHGGEFPWCNGRSLPATLSHFDIWKIWVVWQCCHWHDVHVCKF